MPSRTYKKTSQRGDVSCKRATAVIADYIDDRLSAELSQAFEEHLHACPDCIAFLNTYKKAVQLAKAFLSQESPAPSLGTIERTLEGKVRRVSTR